MCWLKRKIYVMVVFSMLALILLLQCKNTINAQATQNDITGSEQSSTWNEALQVYPAEAIPDSEKPDGLPVYESKKNVSIKAISKNGYHGICNKCSEWICHSRRLYYCDCIAADNSFS